MSWIYKEEGCNKHPSAVAAPRHSLSLNGCQPRSLPPKPMACRKISVVSVSTVMWAAAMAKSPASASCSVEEVPHWDPGPRKAEVLPGPELRRSKRQCCTSVSAQLHWPSHVGWEGPETVAQLLPGHPRHVHRVDRSVAQGMVTIFKIVIAMP